MQVPHWGQKLRVKFMQPPSPSPTKAKKKLLLPQAINLGKIHEHTVEIRGIRFYRQPLDFKN